MTIDNILPVLIGIPWMALCCWLLSWRFPLLQVETRAHAATLPMDGLRGVLASAVFFHHAYITYFFMRTGQWSEPASIFYGQLGPTAVTLFFFISGYLFWRKMLKDPESLRPAKLWPNRFRRLMPAYWTAVVSAFVAIAIASGFRFIDPPRTVLAYAVPWVLVGTPCIPNLNGFLQERVTAGIYWTLRVEVFFYLLLPALIRFRRGWRPILLLPLAYGGYFALKHLHPANPIVSCSIHTVERFLLALMTGFSVGALAAYRPWNARMTAILASPWCAGLGAILLAIHLTMIRGSFMGREPLLLAPIFFMVVSGNSFGGLLTNRPIRCLGQVSYSLYLFHGLILFATTSILDRFHSIAAMSVVEYWCCMMTIAALAVTICTMTYWCIERPFLSRPLLKQMQPRAA